MHADILISIYYKVDSDILYMIYDISYMNIVYYSII